MGHLAGTLSKLSLLHVMPDKEKIIKGVYNDIRVAADCRVIQAEYHRINDWQMDPQGYCLIKIEEKEKIIRVGFCSLPDNILKGEVTGTKSIEIVNTLIEEGMVTTLQHAADMGLELQKAELALQNGLKYIQDGPLVLGSGDDFSG